MDLASRFRCCRHPGCLWTGKDEFFLRVKSSTILWNNLSSHSKDKAYNQCLRKSVRTAAPLTLIPRVLVVRYFLPSNLHYSSTSTFCLKKIKGYRLPWYRPGSSTPWWNRKPFSELWPRWHSVGTRWTAVDTILSFDSELWESIKL